MANKIIGFFNSKERARQVEDDLVEAGFGRTDVHTYEGGDEPGLWDRIREWFGYADEQDRYLYHEAARRGGVAVVCDTSDEDTPTADKVVQIMRRHNPIDLEAQSAQWRKEGWEGYQGPVPGRATGTTTTSGTAGAAVSGQPARTPSTRPAATGKTGESESIPVVQEELHVGKRTTLQGGVRIHSRTTERPVEKQVELREERVQVERRPADRPVRPGERAFEERTIEATESAEKAVVNKEAKVVEEVNVRKDVSQRTETVRDTVRRTDVDVEKLSGERPGTAAPGATSGAGTGAGIGSTTGGATTGSGYAGETAYSGAQGREFVPADFVAEMNRDRRFQGRDWDASEADYRRAYEQRYPQSKWDQVKDRIRTEYNRARSKV